jgi:hypothetical protein
MPTQITDVTVSVTIADKEYGKGTDGFISVKGRYPDPSTLEEVLTDGLDMYFAAWKSLLASRYATGTMSGPDFKESLTKTETKYQKVRVFLAKENGNGQQQQ